MAINANLFGGQNTNQNRQSNSQPDRTPAEYWINLGYQVTVKLEDGAEETRFISLPMGLALDSMKLLPTNSTNELWAQQQGARNNLFTQIMDIAKTLESGEEKILAVDPTNGLAVQLRRVKSEMPPAKPGSNPFAMKLNLVGEPA